MLKLSGAKPSTLAITFFFFLLFLLSPVANMVASYICIKYKGKVGRR